MTDKVAVVKARFEAEGVAITTWARANGFDARKVYRVLSGELKCKRGEVHRIAVALGLKTEPETLQFRR
ncbi:MAG: DNA-binding protein [Bauldia sp.]